MLETPIQQNLLAKKKRRLDEESAKSPNAQEASKSNKKRIISPPNKLLHEVPNSQHYQVSYLHRSTITQIAYSSKHDFVLSASDDGIVKFWKRTPSQNQKCLDFIKSYLAHVGPIVTLVTSSNGGDQAASIGLDGCIKFYDVVSFDVTGMIRVKDILFPPKSKSSSINSANHGYYHSQAAFLTREQHLLAVSAENFIHVFDSATLSSKPIQKISIHASCITNFQYSYERNCVLSADESGVLELWDCSLTTTSGSSSQNNAISHVGESQNDDGNTQQTISVSQPSLSRNGIEYESKLDTDLYVFLKNKRKSKSKISACAIAIALSPKTFAIYSSDRKIRVFHFNTAKIFITCDERIKVYDNAIFQKKLYNIETMDYGKRAATENEINDSPLLQPKLRRTVFHDENDFMEDKDLQLQQLVISFDPSGRFLLIPTLLGIKVMDTKSHKFVRIIGKEDASLQRFISVALCAGEAKVDKQMELARAAAMSNSKTASAVDASTMNKSKSEDGSSKESLSDPLIITLAYQKKRLYVFSNNDPIVASADDEEATNQAILARDVLNEPPDPSDLLSSKTGFGANQSQMDDQNVLGKEAILRTTMGDIHFKLFGDVTPRTVENFCTHSKNGYYDGIIFHRIIKGFMIQTGDPLGDGTGGESIWGGEFEDEFVRELRFDRPFTVAMANAGPGTNGSQFFITTVPTPWLDNKHTIFGRVLKGMDVCSSLENVKVDDMDKPLDEVKIMSVDIL